MVSKIIITVMVCTVGIDNRSGAHPPYHNLVPPTIFSGVTHRSHNRDLEYCMQSEEPSAVRNNA